MRLAFLLALLPTLAGAQDATRHAWGTGDSGPCVLTLALCPDDTCLLRVTLDNRLVWGSTGLTRATLTLDGIAVVVEVEGRAGRAVETLHVLPPVGYMAVPGSLDVGDDASGTVLIVPVPVG